MSAGPDGGSLDRFIDVHVHPPVARFLDGAFAPYVEPLARWFRRPIEPMAPHELADHYRSRGGRAVLLGWDAETATGRPAFRNRDVAALVQGHPDVFIGFGSVDPHKGAAAVTAVHEAARLGLRGIKLHPSAQNFDPSDRRWFPIWEVAEELGLVLLVHTGFTGLGAGEPGGMGVRIGLARPILLEELVIAFPRLQVVMAHPSWPWVEEAIALARHKPNLWLELSGWSPRYLPEVLLREIAGPMRERTLFGTDFPFITVDKWLGDWETLGMDDDLTRAVLHDNAARLLGI